MSYFIADEIRINLDTMTWCAKGGSNNVTPRGSQWLNKQVDGEWAENEIPLIELYPSLDSGEIQPNSKTALGKWLRNYVAYHKNKLNSFGGSWNEATDYYHSRELLRTTKEDLQNSIEYTKKNVRVEYQEREIAKIQRMIDNYDDIISRVKAYDQARMADIIKHVRRTK